MTPLGKLSDDLSQALIALGNIKTGIGETRLASITPVTEAEGLLRALRACGTATALLLDAQYLVGDLAARPVVDPVKVGTHGVLRFGDGTQRVIVKMVLGSDNIGFVIESAPNPLHSWLPAPIFRANFTPD